MISKLCIRNLNAQRHLLAKDRKFCDALWWMDAEREAEDRRLIGGGGCTFQNL